MRTSGNADSDFPMYYTARIQYYGELFLGIIEAINTRYSGIHGSELSRIVCSEVGPNYGHTAYDWARGIRYLFAMYLKENVIHQPLMSSGVVNVNESLFGSNKVQKGVAVMDCMISQETVRYI